MKSSTGMWYLTLAIGGVLLLPGPSWAQAYGASGQKPTQEMMLGQLKGWFDKWDADKDGYLDAKELAKGFRGPYAKAYEPGDDLDKAKEKGPSDYKFLLQCDKDGDGKISRDEYDSWAADYAAKLAPSGNGQMPPGVPMFNPNWLRGNGGPAFPGGYSMPYPGMMNTGNNNNSNGNNGNNNNGNNNNNNNNNNPNNYSSIPQNKNNSGSTSKNTGGSTASSSPAGTKTSTGNNKTGTGATSLSGNKTGGTTTTRGPSGGSSSSSNKGKK